MLCLQASLSVNGMVGEIVMQAYLTAFGAAFFAGLVLSVGKQFLRKITL